jgi:hypothetical protein
MSSRLLSTRLTLLSSSTVLINRQYSSSRNNWLRRLLPWLSRMRRRSTSSLVLDLVVTEVESVVEVKPVDGVRDAVEDGGHCEAEEAVDEEALTLVLVAAEQRLEHCRATSIERSMYPRDLIRPECRPTNVDGRSSML